MAQAARDEAGVKAVLEQWAVQWEDQKKAERQATAQAIPQNKLSFWKAALANLIGSGGWGAISSRRSNYYLTLGSWPWMETLFLDTRPDTVVNSSLLNGCSR